MIKECVVCGRKYNSKGNNICCSKECAINRKKATDKNKIRNKEIECKFCKKIFIGNKTTTYCSKECKSKYMKSNKQIFTNICLYCNKEFTSKKNDTKYCSKECKHMWSKENPRHTIKCEHCGNIFRSNNKNQRFCSYECSNESRALYPRANCEHCGKKFRIDIRQAGRFCSRSCFLNHIGAEPWERKQKIRDITHIRRAKKLQIKYENIKVEEIFEKDKWICKICGEPVDKYLGYPNPMSATLDHIIPLSKGGTHTYNNVQLAHLRCNIKKSNKM